MNTQNVVVPFKERRVADDPWKLRMETKLDELGKALVELVRLEANTHAILQRVERVERRVDAQEDMIRKVVGSEIATSGRSMTTERLLWAIITLGLSGAAFFGFDGGGM